MNKEYLRNVRLKLKMSQQEFANFCGIACGSTICRYESGAVEIPDYVFKILEYNEDVRALDI